MPTPSGATAKYGFPYLLESDAPDVAAATEDLANAIEAIITSYDVGVASARPAAGDVGRLYYATDTHQLTFDTGTAWVTMLSGNPSARIHFTGTQVLTGLTKLTSSTTDTPLRGGMTVVSDAIVVPVAGRYRVSGGACWQLSASEAVFGGTALHNGTQIGNPPGIPFNAGEAVLPFTVAFADEVECAAADTLAFGAWCNSGPVTTAAGSWLAVSLVSQ